MVGVGKIIKQAQKMQKKMESVQQELASKEIVVSSGGGAVTIKINGQSEILGLTIDKEFFKEEKEIIEATLLSAIKEAVSKAKTLSEEELGKVSAGFSLNGIL
ncbi:MAG: nucleoid-associated protein, YbaB/EbfC family [Verrucomicrobia bacterium GWC2_42_7]|nr:MAG: nucleoid-associated protein, YbaB/EbfC family [Verrucomicrobia bacterium GWC2_42_7]